MRHTTNGRPGAGRLPARPGLALGCVLSALLMLPSAPAGAQAAAAPDAPACVRDEVAVGGACRPVQEVADGIRGLVRDTIARAGLKAVIVSVRIGNVPVLTEAWGESITGVPATPDMHFRNGSVAIAYLATILLQLQDEGVIGLDDTLSTWFPDYPEADRITLRMLIGSTSGYGEYVDLEVLPLYDNPFRQWTPDELVAIALSLPMVCDPGTCFAYSHANFVILGEVLRTVTGTPVETLIRDRILEPLALDDTRSDSTAAIQAPVLHGFTAERGVYEDSTYWNPSWTTARGAIMTTDIADLLTSAIAIGSGSLVSPAAHAQIVARPDPLLPPFSEDLFFGLGVLVTQGWVVQTPSFAGYSAAAASLPSREIAIAVTATRGPAEETDTRPATGLFADIGRYLAPDRPPVLPGRRN